MSTKMPRPNQDIEQFLLAAKRAEMHSLKNLSKTCEVVTCIGEFIHHIQRERGLSNVYLASGRDRLQTQRLQQIELTDDCQQLLRQSLHRYYLNEQPVTTSSRLLSCVAFVLQSLDQLKEIREKIETGKVDAATITLAFSRIIAGLLAIVFEAADSSGDPVVSRALIALFNFMQGKEYAGQERAWGAIGFAQGHFDQSQKDRLHGLQSVQHRSFSLFQQFTTPPSIECWKDIEHQVFSTELLRLREMIDHDSKGQRLPSQLSEIWYDITTQRIDAMHQLEAQLLAELTQLSQDRLSAAVQDLKDHRIKLAALPASQNVAFSDTNLTSPITSWMEDIRPPSFSRDTDEGAPIIKSVYDLLRQQAEHLEKTQQELHEARQALTERKLVEQAKGLLMRSLGLSEEAAFRKIQKRAMESNLKLIEVSELIINTANQITSASPKRT